MCKKLLYLMAFVLLMAAGTPAYAGVLLKSNWENGLGTSLNALSDGGIWDHVKAESQGGSLRLEVFPPDHACLEGHNYLAVWLDGHHWGAVYNWDVWPNDIEDIYFRFYIRVKPHNVPPDYIYFGMGHFVQSYQVNPETGGIISRNNWCGIARADATVWKMYGPGQVQQDYYDYPYGSFGLKGLPVNEWLRIEQHVHWLRDQEVPRINRPGETACPSITHFRIYDANGVLIADDDDIIMGDGKPPTHPLHDWTLPEWYANGEYLWRGGNHNSWYMGNNGPVSALGYAGRCVDYACLEIRDDTWPGPVGSGPTTPGQASNPNPSNSATEVSVDADLSWTAGFAATSHDVYFGTDSSPDSGELQGNQTATTFDPNTMTDNTTYYWRIDEVNANGTTQGNVWSFTTEDTGSLPGTASNPSPAHSAVSVSISADLSWTEGADSTSSNVYFGADSTPDSGEYQGNQTATTFDPGTLTNDTTYYWRIDEVNANGTTTGNVWNFTTVAAPTGEVGIIGSWVSGTTHAEEAGSNRALIFIAHAESSADTSDLGSVTYGGQSMTKVVERNMHYSYSAYTCAFILDEEGIDDATSSTFSPSWDTSPSGTPAYTSVFLENVDQATLFGDNSTGGSTTTTAETSPLSNNNGDMAIVAGTCGNNATYSTINSFIEAIEVAPSSADGIGGYIECTGTDVTPGVSHTNVNRQSIIGFVVKATDAGPNPPEKATNPSPSNYAADVAITANLSWTAGSGATSHDVYFGIDSIPDATEFQGNQTATTFEPGTLTNTMTYYWRIDEVNSNGTTVGDVWSFTTIVGTPYPAYNPNPGDSATDVSITADLSWTAGHDANTHDVYFGTDSTPDATEFQGNQTATSFDPGTMTANTTYYWRIDEINTVATTTGTIWSFTTIAAPPADVEIIGSWVEGTTHTEESGSNRALIFIACADSYVVAPDFNSVTYGGQSMTLVIEKNMYTADPDRNTYVCAFVLDEDGIDDASNSTFSPTWDVDPWETPKYISVFLENVNQTTLIGDSDANGTTTTTAQTSPLVNNDGDMAIVAATNADTGTYSTINSFTEAIEVFVPTGDGVAGYLACTGTDVTPGVSHTNVNRQAVIGFVVKAAAAAAPGKASEPGPANSATDVDDEANLSWTAGANATSHDVYFGTSSPGSFQGNQTATTYEPGSLSNSTTYYWRIDEVNASATTTGDVWSFTTGIAAPGAASSPNPANSATNVSVTADLSWTAGSGAAEHHVYFGTFSPGAFQNSQTTTTFNPGIMANDTTYYWRIDEVNAGGTTTGTVWNFTTIVAAPGQATNPGPSNGATDVSIGADLSWTAGTGSTSSDVYFGTDSTPDSSESKGNQTATTYDPGSLSNSTTYYWRIDEVNAGGTTTGSVWSFTTEAAGAGQASNPNPADSATGVSVGTNLSWTAGSGSTSSDVYFGNDSTPDSGELQGNQTATTFDPGTLNNGTTYYWRIDEINAGGTTTGTVWSFTTLTGNVGIIGSWVEGTTHAEEAGNNRALIFIAHADSYVVAPDFGSVTYGGQSMTLVVERNMYTADPDRNTYVCAYILDEAGIDAATSSTFSPTWDVNPWETPAYTSVFLENVNQTILVGATGTGGTTTTTAETSALSTNNGDMAIVAAACGNTGGYTTINGFTEAIEVFVPTGDGIAGYLACTGADVTPGVSHDNVSRQAVIGFVVNAGAAGDVEQIGSWTDGAWDGYSHPAPAGSNRALLVFCHAEENDAPTDFMAVTYGGQSLTQVVERLQNQSSNYSATAEIWILNEAGIQAASGSTIVVTSSSGAETRRISSIFYKNVNQTDPTGATGTDGENNNEQQTLTVALSGGELDAGDIVVANCTVRNDHSGTTDWAWQNSFGELGMYDVSSEPRLTYSVADILADGASETASVIIQNNGVGALAVCALNHN